MLFRRTTRVDRPRLVAASDCEHCRDGLITQPANTVSSLAYVAAGADLLRRPEPDRAFAWAVIAVGVGSVAYHGPGGVAGKWLHDSSLIAMLGLLALTDVTTADGRDMPDAAIAGVVAASALAAHPRSTDYAQGGVGVLAVVAEARRHIRQATVREAAVSLPLLTTGLVLHILGRTDERWCRPDSLLQPHAAWHTLSAAALWTRRRF
ncbi:MAG: hypothetical protein ACTHN0_07335 [Aquihabitans sp.]